MRKLLILACGALLHTMVAAGPGSFDEAAIVQLAKPDDDDSTAKTGCLSEGHTGLGLRFFAVVRQGTQAVIGTYSGSFSAKDKAFVASIGDGRNATVMLDDNGDDVVLKLDMDKGEACMYYLNVMAGNVLGMKGDLPVDEAGMFKLNVADDKKSSPGIDCSNMTDDIQDQYAFVRSDSLLVAGGFWGLADGDSAKLARALGNPRYSMLRSGDGLVVASTTTADAQGKLAAAGCVFPVTITQGSVMGASAPASNSTQLAESNIVFPPTSSLRGAESATDKRVCRQTCLPGGACHTVCRDIWA